VGRPPNEVANAGAVYIFDQNGLTGVLCNRLDAGHTLRLSPATLLCKKSAGRCGKDRKSEDGFRVCNHDTFSSALA
jgi:hypothetical protein